MTDKIQRTYDARYGTGDELQIDKSRANDAESDLSLSIIRMIPTAEAEGDDEEEEENGRMMIAQGED